MPILRTARPEAEFYVLPNRIAEDKSLSWGARGLLIFLLVKPDDWQVSVAHLTNETAMGRDGVRALIKELMDAGYVAHRTSKEAGRFAVGCYEVSDKPTKSPQKGSESTVPPEPVKTAPVEPATVPPGPAGNPLPKTQRNQIPKEPKEPPTPRKRGKEVVALPLPEWMDREAWAAWERHRKGKRWTDEARNLCIRTLGKLRTEGHDPRAVIEQSIANGWTGLFVVRSAGGGRAPANERAWALQSGIHPDSDADPDAWRNDMRPVIEGDLL